MFKIISHQLKILLILILEFLLRIKKISKYLLTRKHEVARILESNADLYEKTMRIDRWLARSNCKPIRDFMDLHFGPESSPASSLPQLTIHKILFQYSTEEMLLEEMKMDDRVKRGGGFRSSIVNLEDGDIIFESALRGLTTELTNRIVRVKKLSEITAPNKDCLSDIIYRILSYKLTIMLANQLASTKYNSYSETHLEKLMNVWNNLIQADKQERSGDIMSTHKAFPPELSNKIRGKDDIVSSRWSHIGFQGEDPGTDFRGMGLLGLVQLEYLSRQPEHVACDLLKRSLNETFSYPFAIVGINITFNLLNLFKDGYMKHLYYDTWDVLFRNKKHALPLLKTFNDLYVELYLRFDCFWQESKPSTIFEFKPLMEEFVNIIRVDLCNRNFSLKFIH